VSHRLSSCQTFPGVELIARPTCDENLDEMDELVFPGYLADTYSTQAVHRPGVL
jgi:hypothetical protein